MKTNIIEISRIDSLGLRDTDYIVCDDGNKAEDIFMEKIREGLRDWKLSEEEIEAIIAEEDNWGTTANGDTLFNADGWDFWVTLIKGVQEI